MAAQHMESPSLYKRLGGYDALAAVTDDFIARLAGDKTLQRFPGIAKIPFSASAN